MAFGAALRLLRTEAGFSIAALAERVGLSSGYLDRLEAGRAAPLPAGSLEAIARALSVPATLLKELALSAHPMASRPVASTRQLYPAGGKRTRVPARWEWVPLDRSRRPVLVKSLPSLLNADRVVLGACCLSWEDAITRAASLLSDEPERVADAIVRRERESSSMLGSGVAVPHALLPRRFSSAALITLRHPLVVPSPDGLPLRVVVVLALDASVAHTRTLAHVARLATPDVADAIYRARTPEQVLEVVGRMPT